jgi:tRNA A37 threonylcarbamoyladenosine synthetase subunit TsaC/SUA5/YrdC
VEATLGKGLDLIVSDMLTVSGMASTVVEWALGGLCVLRRGSIDPAR